MSYRRPLLRDNADIPKSSKDPDQILTRMEHFWSGHGRLGEGMMTPQDRGLRDKTYTEWYGEHESDKPSTTPNGYEGGADLQWEGSVTSPVSHIHRFIANSNINYPSLAEGEAISQISPILHWARTGINRNPISDPRDYTKLHLRAGRFSKNEDSRELETSNDPNTFNSKYSENLNALIRGRAEHLGSMERSPVRDLIRGRGVPEIERIVRERHAGDMERFRQLEPSVFDPNYVRVENIHNLKPSEDYIDLSTGTWAKISPDQFFPH